MLFHPLFLPLLLIPALFPLSRLIGRIARRRKRPPSTTKPAPIQAPLSFLIILGSGGHTAEILTLLQTTLPTFPNAQVTYLTTHTDSHSLPRALAFHQANFPHLKFQTRSVPRARQVGQPYLSSVWSSLKCVGAVWSILHDINPNVVLTNGPATGAVVGAVAVARECFAIGVRVKLVYIESLARVDTMSVSGKLLYRIADRFLVQWPELLEHYPRAEYYGRLT